MLGEIGGAQAQLLSAAGLSVWARVEDLEPADVDRAVGEERSWARAWCMRRTLHLLPSSELAMFVRGSARRAEKEIRWAHNAGIPKPALDRTIRALFDSLDHPRSRAELTEQLGRRLRVATRAVAGGGGWGNRSPRPWIPVGGVHLPTEYLLHLAGARGVLCSGPGRGSEATYVRADAWVPGWRDLPQAEAEDRLLRRYVHAYGPAAPADFMAWTRMRLRDAREIWDRNAEAFAPVQVGLQPSWVLREDLPDLLRSGDPPGPARLLPFFDAFLLGHLGREHLLPAAELRRVYRPQGWVAPTILVDGVVRGVWEHAVTGGQLRVRLRPFQRLERSTTTELRAEAHELGRFLGAERVTVTPA